MATGFNLSHALISVLTYYEHHLVLSFKRRGQYKNVVKNDVISINTVYILYMYRLRDSDSILKLCVYIYEDHELCCSAS